jgi:hypothetical protein
MAGTEKLIQILPWMTAISNTGIPADLNVNSSTTSTTRIDTTFTTMLSREKVFCRSYWLTDSPHTSTPPS